MLYQTPALDDDDRRVLGELDTMRDNLRYRIAGRTAGQFNSDAS